MIGYSEVWYAYGLGWLIFFGYLVYLGRRVARVERDVTKLSENTK